MSRRARVPGMAGVSYHIPVCSDCGSKTQKNDVGEWFCLRCFDGWLAGFLKEKGVKAVKLPAGVEDPRPRPSFRDLMPNRRARRG